MSFNDRLGMHPRPEGGVYLEAGPEHEVAPGTIHFAVLTTLGEVAAASAVGSAVVPVDVQVQLLRRARPGRIDAVPTVTKNGRSLAFARSSVQQDGTEVAEVHVTFAKLDQT